MGRVLVEGERVRNIMSQPRMFTGVELTDALSKAGSSMNRKVSAYLIGGCAMTFMGRKGRNEGHRCGLWIDAGCKGICLCYEASRIFKRPQTQRRVRRAGHVCDG